ncbi:MAG: rod shape-determining protein MreD [Halothiobacillaceae bacterium]
MRSDWPTIAASLAAALILTLAPLPREIGVFAPQWLLLVVLFWSIERPERVGLVLAWSMGLLLDIGTHALLGSNALLFVLAAALTLGLQRLLKPTSIMQQGLYVCGLTLAYLMVELWMRGGMQGSIEGWQYLMRSISNLAAWPLLVLTIAWLHRRLG